MYSLELPIQTLIEVSDLMGLSEAWESRVKHIGEVMKVVHGLVATQELSDLKKRGRRATRTFKGLQQVTAGFYGQPKGLEAIGLDRVKQAAEEMKRLKGEMIQLISDFDRVHGPPDASMPLGPR